MQSNTKLAFTLAEVLIVLTIIGIVAAITIPALMQSTQDQQLKVAWKKEYSVISNAYNQILNENGGNIKGLCSDSNCFMNLFSQKLNVQKVCTSNAQTDCYVQGPKVKNLAGVANNNMTKYATSGMILVDGSFVGPVLNDSSCNHMFVGTKPYCGSIIVDVNGIKPPNIQGKDIFWAMVYEDKLQPAGVKADEAYSDGGDSEHSCGTSHLTADYEGLGCSALYLQNQ